MKKADKIHLLTILMLNFGIVLKLINVSWNGNDKAILLIVFGYPLLIIINGLIWLVLKSLKKPQSEIYKIITMGLLILFIPTIIISIIY